MNQESWHLFCLVICRLQVSRALWTHTHSIERYLVAQKPSQSGQCREKGCFEGGSFQKATRSHCLEILRDPREFFLRSQKAPEILFGMTPLFGKLRAWEIDRKGKIPKLCLGEGAKGSFGPMSKGLRKVFRTTQNCFCTGAHGRFGWCKRLFGDLVLPGSKRPSAPSPKHFWEFFPFSVNFPGPQLPNTLFLS